MKTGAWRVRLYIIWHLGQTRTCGLVQMDFSSQATQQLNRDTYRCNTPYAGGTLLFLLYLRRRIHLWKYWLIQDKHLKEIILSHSSHSHWGTLVKKGGMLDGTWIWWESLDWFLQWLLRERVWSTEFFEHLRCSYGCPFFLFYLVSKRQCRRLQRKA